MQVVPSHNDSPHHLGGLDDACSGAGEGREPSGRLQCVEWEGRCFVASPAVLPVKIRPRMATLPVKGHFLSTYTPGHVAGHENKKSLGVEMWEGCPVCMRTWLPQVA